MVERFGHAVFAEAFAAAIAAWQPAERDANGFVEPEILGTVVEDEEEALEVALTVVGDTLRLLEILTVAVAADTALANAEEADGGRT